MATKMPAVFRTMIAAIRALKPLGFLKAYEDDFKKHDRAALGLRSGEFLWMVRPCGTELMFEATIIESMTPSSRLDPRSTSLLFTYWCDQAGTDWRAYLGNTAGTELRELTREDITSTFERWFARNQPRTRAAA